jgi:hypothetical protein
MWEYGLVVTDKEILYGNITSIIFPLDYSGDPGRQPSIKYIIRMRRPMRSGGYFVWLYRTRGLACLTDARVRHVATHLINVRGFRLSYVDYKHVRASAATKLSAEGKPPVQGA